MIALLMVALFVSCDGNILSTAVVATPKIDIIYRNIIGLDNDTSPTKVYYQTSNGIWSAEAQAQNKVHLYSNKSGGIVDQTAMMKSNKAYILFRTNATDDEAGKHINVMPTSTLSTDASYTTCKVTNLGDNEKIVHMYNNGMLLITNTSTKTYSVLNEYSLVDIANKVVTYSQRLDFDASLATDGYDIERICQQTGKENDITAPFLISFIKSNQTNSGTTYPSKIYYVDPTTSIITYIGSIKYRIANFVKDNSGYLYLFTTTSGNKYRSSALVAGGSTEPTQISNTTSGYYEPNAFMLHIYHNSTNYVITKTSTKSSGLLVYSFPDGATSNITTTTIKKGYAYKVMSDLVTSCYLLSTDSNQHRLLMATNKSGMATINIMDDLVTNNSDANGWTTGFEGYSF